MWRKKGIFSCVCNDDDGMSKMKSFVFTLSCISYSIYIYIYTNLYLCVYIHVCIHACARMIVYMYIRMHIYTGICAYVKKHFILQIMILFYNAWSLRVKFHGYIDYNYFLCFVQRQPARDIMISGRRFFRYTKCVCKFRLNRECKSIN